MREVAGAPGANHLTVRTKKGSRFSANRRRLKNHTWRMVTGTHGGQDVGDAERDATRCLGRLPVVGVGLCGFEAHPQKGLARNAHGTTGPVGEDPLDVGDVALRG